MCLYPKLIQNPKYKKNKKNKGEIPPCLDERVKYVPIGCTNCIECRKQKAREWQVRLLEDVKQNKNGVFVTLTFSNQSIREIIEQEPTKNWPGLKHVEGYELDNQIATRAVRLFLERWRKKYKKSLRHWLITELGHNGTENIHLHGIIWTDYPQDIKNIWGYGYVWDGYTKLGRKINYVNGKTVNYIVKYITKIDKKHTLYKSKILTSAGIGANYIGSINQQANNYNNGKTIETYRTGTGHKIAMPIYWRNKIYTEEEREKLWLQRLDKNERWILGTRIDFNQPNAEKHYYRLLEIERERAARLGYGDDSDNWEKKQYENMRRKLMYEERLKTPPAGY